METFHVYPMCLVEPLATMGVPLLPADAAVVVDLQAVFDRCYDADPYAREIDYGTSLVLAALRADQAAWITEILRNRRD